jgi:general secretion pathway protein G
MCSDCARRVWESRQPRSLRRGFTLVEVMVVLVILGLLAGLVTANVRNYLIQGKQRAAAAQIATFAQAIESFAVATGDVPTTQQGLAALTARDERMPEPLLKRVPLDPWGRAYQYVAPGRTDRYEVISFGRDGREGGSGEDADISSERLDDPAGGTGGAGRSEGASS